MSGCVQKVYSRRRPRSTKKEIKQLTMRAILRCRCSTTGWPPLTILVGDIVSRARRHEMPMPMDVEGEGSDDGSNRRSGDLF